MTKRHVNKQLIREWIHINGKGSLERLAYKSGCSASLVQKLISDSYDGIPKIDVIDGICLETGYEMDELFPITKQEKSA